MAKTEILGTTKVGILKHNDSEKYLGWNNNAHKFFLTDDLNQANIIIGNKKLNTQRIIELYRKSHINDKSTFTLEIKDYVYAKNGNNFFAENTTTVPAIAYAYNTDITE